MSKDCFRVGSFICIRYPDFEQSFLHFGKITKVLPATAALPMRFEVAIYFIPEIRNVGMEDWLLFFYPSVQLSHELALLSRLSAGLFPTETERMPNALPVVVERKHLILADFFLVRAVITGMRPTSAKKRR